MSKCAECQAVKERTGFALLCPACYAEWEQAWDTHARSTVDGEKGRGEVGPHTHARNTQGCEKCHAPQLMLCPCCTATPTATHATQPTQPQALDTTSHG